MTIRSVLITLVATIAVLSWAAFTCYHAGYEDGERDLIQKIKDDTDQRQQAQQLIADKVLKGLSDWQQNTKIVEIRNEKTNTVFRNVCVTPEYQRLYNDRVTDAETRLSGRTGSKVSDGKPTEVKRGDRG